MFKYSFIVILFLLSVIGYTCEEHIKPLSLSVSHISVGNMSIDIIPYTSLEKWGKEHSNVTLIKITLIDTRANVLWVKLEYSEYKPKPVNIDDIKLEIQSKRN